jgi:hypothetical protein
VTVPAISKVFVSFGSGTGSGAANHDILAREFRNTRPAIDFVNAKAIA